jgi:hypothetical protein
MKGRNLGMDMSVWSLYMDYMITVRYEIDR